METDEYSPARELGGPAWPILCLPLLCGGKLWESAEVQGAEVTNKHPAEANWGKARLPGKYLVSVYVGSNSTLAATSRFTPKSTTKHQCYFVKLLWESDKQLPVKHFKLCATGY